MIDIMERLRIASTQYEGWPRLLFKDARGEIERLRALVPEQEGASQILPDADGGGTPTPPSVRSQALEEIAAHIHELCCRAADDNPLKDRIHAARDCIDRALSLPALDGGSAAAAAPFASRQSLPPALQDALGEIEAFLQDHHDIRDGAGGQQLPNKAMSLSIALKEALGERP